MFAGLPAELFLHYWALAAPAWMALKIRVSMVESVLAELVSPGGSGCQCDHLVPLVLEGPATFRVFAGQYPGFVVTELTGTGGGAEDVGEGLCEFLLANSYLRV